MRSTDKDSFISLPDAVLVMARSQLGLGEEGGDNKGPEVDKYRHGKTRGAWCAYFVSWCIEQACEKLVRPMPIKPSGSARVLFRRIAEAGTSVSVPLTGAVACWSRGAGNTWKGHIGLVSRVDGNQFWSIEGNRGRYPSKVREYNHEVGEAKLLGFAILL